MPRTDSGTRNKIERNAVSDIDPMQFGVLTAQVAGLQKEVDSLARDVRELLELANKSRGGFWAGMTIASAIGAIGGWLLIHFGFVRQ